VIEHIRDERGRVVALIVDGGLLIERRLGLVHFGELAIARFRIEPSGCHRYGEVNFNLNIDSKSYVGIPQWSHPSHTPIDSFWVCFKCDAFPRHAECASINEMPQYGIVDANPATMRIDLAPWADMPFDVYSLRWSLP
jgi:hypothetical protein